ncbi:hypothetical protein P879_01991 [Paragonimus westermani]|uniref:Cytochrome c oxidase subunit 5b n=1 Tax=Paragonimus westermani TaxID=34504 RepID=A0A8T0DQB3_9TREM|nr:hypothetical protein P879_01991 [Paragonimus westermani]
MLPVFGLRQFRSHIRKLPLVRNCFNNPEPTGKQSFPILSDAVNSKNYGLVSKLISDLDPYEVKRVKMQTMSSEASPNLVASDYSSRMIGCVCEPEADAINWMELTKGDPVKCYCGHWFQLVDYEEYFRRTAS